MTKVHRLLLAAVAGAVVALLLALKLRVDDGARLVEVDAATTRVLAPTILASGTLTYRSAVTLMSEVLGRVDVVTVREGDMVTRGQLLVQLDAGPLRAEITQLESSRRQSELNIRRQEVQLKGQSDKLERYRMLRAAGMVEALRYDELVTNLQLAEVELAVSREALKQTSAVLKQAYDRLAKTEIRSPMAGKVTAVHIKAGETAVPSASSFAGSSLLALGDATELYAEVQVDESDVGRVEVGQSARIVPAAYPDKALTGTVERVALTPRRLDPNGNGGPPTGNARTYAVKVRLAAPTDVTFFPGMSGRAEISTRRTGVAPSLAVAVQAVRRDDSPAGGQPATSVMVVAEGKVVRRVIDAGVADDDYIEVLRGLQQGEQVIVGPPKILRVLREGERVRLQAPAPQTPLPAASGPAGVVERPANGLRPPV
ncbi:MAG: efflux RND transporter periplasmic adaptor subunit [Rubrivivax sp.]|jgi:HlyD family secretion protein|nr:efflux RND transporter periplasmic adaptor subunit [Rubrivivax sp.]